MSVKGVSVEVYVGRPAIATNVLRLAAGGEIEFLSAGTVAKFINKSSLFTTIAQ